MKDHVIESTATLAAAADLVRVVLQQVMGNELSDHIDGRPVTTQILNDLALTGFQTVLESKEVQE